MTKAQRQRLINAVLFFATRTKSVGKVKLFKLVYLMDFEHFRQTGNSITGLDYQAWPLGPVPASLKDEWESGFAEDLARLVSVQHVKVIDYIRQAVVPNEGAIFDDEYFSPRQLGIMTQLAEQYSDTLSEDMIDVTHAQNGAWDQVWKKGEGIHQPIPYELAAPRDADGRSQVLGAAADSAAFSAAFG